MSDEHVTIGALREAVSEFNAAREWQDYHAPRNLAESICIEAAELLECFQWGPDWPDRDERKKELNEELADILIYCLSFANVCEIDISEAIMSKLEKNGERYPVEIDKKGDQ